MKASARIRRKAFLGAGAAGLSALALPGRVAAAATRAPVVIDFWNPALDMVTRQQINGIVAKFNRTIGKAQGFSVRNRPVSNENNMVKYTTAMTSAAGPDAVMTYSYDEVPAWAANGFVQPMDSYFAALGLKQSDFIPVAWNMIKFGGHVWGLLQEFDLDQLFYNRSIHHGPPPKTLDELDALAPRYNKFDKKGNLIQAGFVPWEQTWRVTDWAAVWGARFYDNVTGRWTINTPRNRKPLEWFVKHAHLMGGRAQADALVSTIPKGYGGFGGDLFQSGKAAFALEGEYVLAGWKVETPTLKFGIAPLPTAPGVPYGSAVALGGNVLLLPRKSPHPREAAIFLQYMGSPGPVADIDIASIFIPPLRTVASSAAFLKVIPEAFVTTLRFDHIVAPIPSPQLPVFGTELANAVDEVTYLRKTPAEALAVVEQKVTAAVRQFKQIHPIWLGE